jgi:hypothetical protein
MANTDREGPEATAGESDAEAEAREPGAHGVPDSAPLPPEVEERLAAMFGRSSAALTGQPDEAAQPAAEPDPDPDPAGSYWGRQTGGAATPPASAQQASPPLTAPGTSGYDPYGPLPPAPAPSLAPEPAPPPAHQSRRTFALVLVAVVVLLVGTGVVVFALNGGDGTKPAAALETAVANLHRAKTAQVALNVAVNAGGEAVRMTGNGETNVLTNATNETITYNLAGTSFTARAIIDGPTAYFNYGVGVGRIVPGKSWVSMKVGQSAASGSEGTGIFSDPNAMLAVLASPGAVVRAIGASEVNGVAVQGYSIDLGPAGIARLLRSAYFPPSVKAAMESAHYSHLDYIAFIDASNRLRDLRTVANFSVSGNHFTVQGDMSLSDYGVRVSITDPPASEVVTFQEFEKIAAQSQGTASS